jgi:hypothetical protein
LHPASHVSLRHVVLTAAMVVSLAGLCIPTEESSAQGQSQRPAPATVPGGAEIQAAAQRIEAARRSEPAQGDPFEELAEALQSTRAALADGAALRARGGPADPAVTLAQRAAALRGRCDALRQAATQKPSLTQLVDQLEDRCARLLAAIDEIGALPDAQARSQRAVALLAELAAAGPRGRDPARAPPEPTFRGMEGSGE